MVLEHEGIGLGLVAAATFFFGRNYISVWVFVAGVFMILNEYQINQFADFKTAPFDIFISAILGFFFAFGILRVAGSRETDH